MAAYAAVITAARPGTRPARGLDPIGLGLDVAAAGPVERRDDLSACQSRRRDRVRRLAEQLESIDGVEVVERLQCGRKILAQCMPQPLDMAGAFPYQGLVCLSDDLDRLGLGAVTGHRPQLVRIGADHVGQHVRIGGAALGARDPPTISKTSCLQRIHREHHVMKQCSSGTTSHQRFRSPGGRAGHGPFQDSMSRGLECSLSAATGDESAESLDPPALIRRIALPGSMV